MQIDSKEIHYNGLNYIIRSATIEDAGQLSDVRVIIDRETTFMDREPGEGFMDEVDFSKLICEDLESKVNLFLVVVIGERIAGYARCQGSNLKRFAHKVEFGICILKEFWGYKMGTYLLENCIQWADFNGIKKMTLHVVESNDKALNMYKNHGFEVEGILKNDKRFLDGTFLNTIVMGRITY